MDKPALIGVRGQRPRGHFFDPFYLELLIALYTNRYFVYINLLFISISHVIFVFNYRNSRECCCVKGGRF